MRKLENVPQWAINCNRPVPSYMGYSRDVLYRKTGLDWLQVWYWELHLSEEKS